MKNGLNPLSVTHARSPSIHYTAELNQNHARSTHSELRICFERRLELGSLSVLKRSPKLPGEQEALCKPIDRASYTEAEAATATFAYLTSSAGGRGCCSATRPPLTRPIQRQKQCNLATCTICSLSPRRLEGRSAGRNSNLDLYRKRGSFH